MHTLPQQLANGLFIGSMYGLIAVGYTMVYGIVQLINFAHGEIYMTGAFGALTVWTNLPHGTSIWLALPLMLLGGGIVSVLIAVGAERFAYRPLHTAPRLAPLITAIGLSLALQQAIFIWYPGADNAKPFPQLGTHAYHVGSIDIQRGDIFLVASAAICMTFLAVFVRTSRTGRAMQATAQDPDTAKLMGIDTNRIIVIAFAIGGFFAAVAGLASGLKYGQIRYDMGFQAGLKAFTAAVLGGIGNIYGAMLGGGSWANVWAFVLLILVLLVRPQGLLGERTADRA